MRLSRRKVRRIRKRLNTPWACHYGIYKRLRHAWINHDYWYEFKCTKCGHAESEPPEIDIR